jgi:hypothetical protein
MCYAIGYLGSAADHVAMRSMRLSPTTVTVKWLHAPGAEQGPEMVKKLHFASKREQTAAQTFWP